MLVDQHCYLSTAPYSSIFIKTLVSVGHFLHLQPECVHPMVTVDPHNRISHTNTFLKTLLGFNHIINLILYTLHPTILYT